MTLDNAELVCDAYVHEDRALRSERSEHEPWLLAPRRRRRQGGGPAIGCFECVREPHLTCAATRGGHLVSDASAIAVSGPTALRRWAGGGLAVASTVSKCGRFSPNLSPTRANRWLPCHQDDCRNLVYIEVLPCLER